MNILTDELPKTVLVGNRTCRIETDFRPCLRTIIACEDDALTKHEKAQIILTNLFRNNDFFSDPESALEQAQWFLDGGRSGDAESERSEENQIRLYSFTKDANFIYAAFRQTHGLDLQTADLHWWQFLALFLDLGSDTTFCQLVALRKRVKTGKASKEERTCANEIKDIFDIEEPDLRSLEEREAEELFMNALKEAKSKQK
jgi:hypothetical protein